MCQSGPVFLSSVKIVLGNIVLDSTHYDSTTVPWKHGTMPWKYSAGTLRGFSGPRLCTIHSPLPVCCIHNTNTTWTARNMHTLGENFLRISCCMSRPGLTWWCLSYLERLLWHCSAGPSENLKSMLFRYAGFALYKIENAMNSIV